MGKEFVCSAGDPGDAGSIPGSGRSQAARKEQPIPVFLPENSHGQRILVGYSPKCHKELDTTKWLSTHAFNKNVRKYYTINILKACL